MIILYYIPDILSAVRVVVGLGEYRYMFKGPFVLYCGGRCSCSVSCSWKKKWISSAYEHKRARTPHCNPTTTIIYHLPTMGVIKTYRMRAYILENPVYKNDEGRRTIPPL